MIESLVDYVLERGNVDYGEFTLRGQIDKNSATINHRKLLQYLFDNSETQREPVNKKEKRISDLKISQISSQLSYFSEKIHTELVKQVPQKLRKHLTIDSDLYKLQNEWMRKKIPEYYCYYFLKFSYANSYSRMHELFLSEIENMNRQKDSYAVIKKTIEGREVCMANLRRELSSFTQLDLEESLETLREEKAILENKKIKREKGSKVKRKNQEEANPGKSWKNRLELIFQSISHLRKLTCFVVELIKNWKNSIYGISQDPRRYRERVIFYHKDANYLLKMLFDNKFISESLLKTEIEFAKHYDPFLLKPCLVLQNMSEKSEDDEILFSLLKPTDVEMDKIVKSLVLMAQEEYQEDQQSKVINQKRSFGELDHRKQYIDRKRDLIGLKDKAKSEVKLPYEHKEVGKLSDRKRRESTDSKEKGVKFVIKKEPEEVKPLKRQSQSRIKINSALSRVKNIRSVDLKKVSPYLNRNDRMGKAQKAVDLEYKFKLAQSDYAQHLKAKKQEIKHTQINQKWAEENKDVINSRIFNRYIEENLKVMEEANRKAYHYKNRVSEKGGSVSSMISRNRIGYSEKKEVEYERNLAKYQKPLTREGPRKGTKAIIEISNKGIKSSENVFKSEMQIAQGKTFERKPISGEKEMKESRLESPKKDENRAIKFNLFESQKAAEIIIMRQQPEKIQEIKQYLYTKIKEQLMQEMKRSAIEKQDQINNLIEEEKQRKIDEIMEARRLEEQRRKAEEERMRIAQLEMERSKIDFDIRVEPIQYAEQNVNQYFDKIFQTHTNTFQRIFTNEKLSDLKEKLMNDVFVIFLVGYDSKCEEVAYSILHFEWTSETIRTFVVDYLAVKTDYLYISSFHKILEYMWAHDPVQQIEIIMFKNEENREGQKFIADVHQYANRFGDVFEKRLYSNIVEMKYLWQRPSAHKQIQFPYTHFYFGKKLNFKSQLLSAQVSFSQRFTPKIDMNLQAFTSYAFLIQELFRSYLTPQEVVQLRENSTNIRRLKDIFRIVLELEKSNPKVNELTIVEGRNLDDLYSKLQERVSPPYDKYYWHHFYDKTESNRVLLAILETNLELEFPINSCRLDDRRFLRINPRRKVLVLRSSVYSKENIYILSTNNPKIRIFFMQGEHYKLMRIQLFIFLNLVFNNIVEDSQKFVNSFWIPQFAINSDSGKEIKRVTDFSITMKKSFFLSEEIYFCNHQYVKNGVSLLPRASDVTFREAMIFGFLHTSVEKGTTGMPIYAKLIDRSEMF